MIVIMGSAIFSLICIITYLMIQIVRLKIDKLTNLPRKEIALGKMKEIWKRAKKKQTVVGTIMLDIDHFKKVNDTYGHDGGDECLAAMGKIIKQQVRETDKIVGRYGGEEFIVILYNTTPEGVRLVAERLRQAIQDENVLIGNTRVNLTISVGVDYGVPYGSAEEAIKRADNALYKAKEGGRNRVDFSEEQDLSKVIVLNYAKEMKLQLKASNKQIG